VVGFLGLHLREVVYRVGELMPLKSLMVLITLLGVASCPDTEKAKPAGVIPEAQLQALEKARGVENELKKQHEELREKLDEE
jgi:hypothetical protein